MSTSILSLAWFVTLLTLVCFAIDASFRRYGNLELHRKACHVLGSLWAYFVIVHWPASYAIVSAVLLGIGMTFVRQFRLSALLNHATETKRGYGETYFAASVLIMLAVSYVWPNLAGSREVSVAILITALADGLAPFGRYLWHHPLYGSKTFWGTLVCFAVSALIAFAFLDYQLSYALSFGMAIALTELFSTKGSDNFTVPMASFAISVLARHLP